MSAGLRSKNSKVDLRARMQKMLAELDTSAFKMAGLQTLSHAKTKFQSPIGIFKSFPMEIDTQPWLEHFGPTLLPGKDPEAYAKALLEVGATSLFVPGLAFDRRGGRLGRGGGYYDRCIAALRRSDSPPRVIGLCLQQQMVEHVPLEAHDEKMDAVLNPLNFLCVQSPSLPLRRPLNK